MKRSILALVFAGIALGSLASAQAAVETYDIDPVHTWVGFSISHFFTKVPGFFSKVKGTGRRRSRPPRKQHRRGRH